MKDKQAVARKKAAPRESSITIDFGHKLVPYSAEISAVEALKNPAIMTVVNMITTAVMSVPWYCELDPNYGQGGGDLEKKAATIQAALDNPAPGLNAHQMRQWMALNYAVFGKVAFCVGSMSGDVIGFYPLDGTQVTRELNRLGVKGYWYAKDKENQEYYGVRNEDDPKQERWAYEIYNPTIYGSNSKQVTGRESTPLDVVGGPSKIVELLLQRALDTASGAPNVKYMLQIMGATSEDMQKKVVSKFKDMAVGSEGSGQVKHIFWDKEIVTHKFENNLSDIHSKVSLDDMTRRIAQAFGVPVPLLNLGGADSAKYAGNYEQARLSFIQDTIIPGYLEPISGGLTAALCPKGLRIKFDLDAIPAIRAARISDMERLSKSTFLTIDEIRELAGYGPLKEGETPYKAEKPKEPHV